MKMESKDSPRLASFVFLSVSIRVIRGSLERGEDVMPWLRSLVALLVCSVVAVAGDWPQWLGPNRDGSSPEKVSPWKEAPKVLWRKPVGEGNSGPVVADGRVY